MGIRNPDFVMGGFWMVQNKMASKSLALTILQKNFFTLNGVGLRRHVKTGQMLSFCMVDNSKTGWLALCPDFECFRYLNVRFLDPHCLYSHSLLLNS